MSFIDLSQLSLAWQKPSAKLPTLQNESTKDEVPVLSVVMQTPANRSATVVDVALVQMAAGIHRALAILLTFGSGYIERLARHHRPFSDNHMICRAFDDTGATSHQDKQRAKNKGGLGHEGHSESHKV